MKRTGPLKRKGELKRDTPLETRTGLDRRTPLTAKSRLQSTVSALKPGRPKRRVPERSKAEEDARRAWHVQAMRPLARCENPDCPYGGVQGQAPRLHGHHSLRRQRLERLAAEAGLNVVTIAWDRRWMILICEHCHASHHARSRRLPAAAVPMRAVEAARSLDRCLREAARPATAMIELCREYGVSEESELGPTRPKPDRLRRRP